MKHFQDPGQPTPIASRTLLSHPLPQSLDPILLKSNRRKKRLLRSSEQTKFFSIGAWIFNHQSDPCKSKPCNSSSNPVRAHKHFFPSLCRSITPLFTDSHKSALFFFFSSFLSRSLVIRSFVHSPLSLHPPRIYIPARFPSIPWIQRPREPAKFRGWILSTARGGRRIAHGVGLTTG